MACNLPHVYGSFISITEFGGVTNVKSKTSQSQAYPTEQSRTKMSASPRETLFWALPYEVWELWRFWLQGKNVSEESGECKVQGWLAACLRFKMGKSLIWGLAYEVLRAKRRGTNKGFWCCWTGGRREEISRIVEAGHVLEVWYEMQMACSWCLCALVISFVWGYCFNFASKDLDNWDHISRDPLATISAGNCLIELFSGSYVTWTGSGEVIDSFNF